MDTAKNTLTQGRYFDKVFACWQGKRIGANWGRPYQGSKERLNVPLKPKIRKEAATSCDLDLQLLWLHALEQYGPHLTSNELGNEWVDHVFDQFDKHATVLMNLRLGLIPPHTSHGNPFLDCLGSPVRSEIWACISPGRPDTAVYYAYQDARVDHAGGEGEFGEIFYAALQSSAFMQSDKKQLLRIAGSFLPDHSITYEAIQYVIEGYEAGLEWVENRERIVIRYSHQHFTYAPLNIAFTIIGLLYGVDFSNALQTTINCGYDTVSNGAAIGALLGICGGTAVLPKEALDSIGEQIVISPYVNGFVAPKDVNELTERVCVMANQAAVWGESVRMDFDTEQLLMKHPTVRSELLPLTSRSDALLRIDHLLEGSPTVRPGSSYCASFRITNQSKTAWYGQALISVPSGWLPGNPATVSLAPGKWKELHFDLKTGEDWADSYPLELRLIRYIGDSPWSERKIGFALLPERCWSLTLPSNETIEMWSSDTRIPYPSMADTMKGKLLAETWVDNHDNQTIRMIVTTNDNPSVSINGKPVKRIETIAEYSSLQVRQSPWSGYWVAMIPFGGGNVVVELELKPDVLAPEVRMWISGSCLLSSGTCPMEGQSE